VLAGSETAWDPLSAEGFGAHLERVLATLQALNVQLEQADQELVSPGKANEAALTRFLDSRRVGVLACDEQTSHSYADLKLQLAKQGTPIPINDVWIAALVLQHGLALRTLDRNFDRSPRLARV
jgi:predicted nucleic acid-binding protein